MFAALKILNENVDIMRLRKVSEKISKLSSKTV
jgi:hypothetical protein